MAVRRIALLLSVLGGAVVAFVRRHRRTSDDEQPARRVRVVPRRQLLRTHDADEISIVSYNILADQFANKKRMAYVQSEFLAWEHRLPLILQELQETEADLVCLQEVDADRWPELVQNSPLAATYQGLLQDRKDMGVGCALLYKPGKLELLWSESRSRALLAAFRFYDSYGVEQVLYVINCHLEGSPYRPNDRVSQMKSALQRLQQCQQQRGGAQPRDCSVVVCGDFNSGRNESVWRLLHRGRLEANSTEVHLPNISVTQTTVSHPYILQDVYHATATELPFTRKVPTLGSTLDYIFASSDFQVSAVYWPLTSTRVCCDQLMRLSLPNHTYPSDHLPIGTILRLRQPSLASQRLYHDAQQNGGEAPEGPA